MAGSKLNHPKFRSAVVLALDTSSKATSMAVARGDEVLAEFEGVMSEERSESLWDEISALLQRAGCGIRDVDLYSVCIGPGAFTGLRVGIAAAKGLASAMAKPMVGITSLEALAYSAKDCGVVCALMNGYRGEVYWQVFALDADSLPVARAIPLSTSLQLALDNVEEAMTIITGGDGAEELADSLFELLRLGALEDTPARIIRRQQGNRAVLLAQLALARFEAGAAVSPEALTACYVRPAEAEIKLARGLLGQGMGQGIRRGVK